MLPGCCDLALGKCGVVSAVRPGCITQSSVTVFPDPLKPCGDSHDGGALDAACDDE
jgi:hypothetical protein